MKLKLGFLLAIFLVGCAGGKSRLKLGTSDDGEVVEAEGMVPYNPQDLIATKKAALTEAQRDAVEKSVGVYVSARTMVEKAVAIENNILARTEGYVKKFDILKEGPDGEFYKTRIRALVALKNLEADLKEMSLLKGPELYRPRLHVGLSEKIDKQEIDEHPAQTALEKALISQGYALVISSDIGSAELSVTGKASSFPFQSEKLGGFISYRARISLQVNRPGVKDVFYSMTTEASGIGGNAELAGLKALESVGDYAAQELGGKISEKYGKGRTLLIFVEGVKSFGDVERVKKHLVSQPGVGDVVLRLYDEGMAQFECLLGSLKPSELAARLEASQSLPLQVAESSDQIIRLKLK